MNSRKISKTRRSACLQAEGLETRALLTAGAGNNFAIVNASVTAANVSSSIPFTVTPNLFTRPNGRITIGVDVAQKSASTVKPLIYKITDSTGHAVSFQRAVYNPHIQRAQILNGNITTSVLANIRVPRTMLAQSQTYTVHVTGEDNTTGAFLVGFYLPGDASGKGVVDSSSIKAVKAAMNTSVGDAKYNFAADANRDGVINRADLSITQRNLGAGTTITPVISANLDPATDTGLPDRITKLHDVTFNGTATPGATITYSDMASKVPTVTTTANAAGNYALKVHLADGANQFKVSAADAFGQSISGQIDTVTSSPNALPSPTDPVVPKKTV